MGDFWLKNGSHECFFVRTIEDLIPGKFNNGWPYRNWRLKNFSGSLFQSDDELLVSGRSLNREEGVFSIRAQNLKQALAGSIDIWKPTTGHFAGVGHFFWGTVQRANNYDECYLFKFRDTSGNVGVLFQRYIFPGTHQGEIPRLEGNLSYEEPLVPVAEIRIMSAGDEPPDLKVVIPTQDDEGGGYVP